VLGNPLADGKAHQIYAYAISQASNSRYALLMGSPKSITGCTSTTGTVEGGGGRSGRHNYLTPCEGTGLAGPNDPAIYIEVKADGTIVGGVDASHVTGAVTIKINGQTVTGTTFTLKKGDTITVTTAAGTFTADTDGLVAGDNASILVPMPCIRIGYDDVLGGQQCGAGQDGTCADELDAFINVDGLQNAGLHISIPPDTKGDDFEVYYKVVGDQTNTNGWKLYDWRHCGQYSDHCIRLKGKGVISARTKVISSGSKFTAGSYSLTASKEYDVAAGKF
jgi:hypothetical protein